MKGKKGKVLVVHSCLTLCDPMDCSLPGSHVMLKILQGRLQQYMNFQMFKLDFEKAEEPEIKLPTSIGSLKK